VVEEVLGRRQVIPQAHTLPHPELLAPLFTQDNLKVVPPLVEVVVEGLVDPHLMVVEVIKEGVRETRVNQE